MTCAGLATRKGVSRQAVAMRVLQLEQAVTTLVQTFRPPREIGTTWSRVSDSRCRSSQLHRPQYWHR